MPQQPTTNELEAAAEVPGQMALPMFPTPDTEVFYAVQTEALALFVTKNKGYNASYNDDGALGVAIRMRDKLNRIIAHLKGDGPTDEKLEDNLLDLHVYAAIGLFLTRRGNLRGA